MSRLGVFFLEFSLWFSYAYARWKGTGKPCPNFLWKLSKISLYRFEKFFVLWYGYVAPFHMVYEFWTFTPQLRLWHFWTTVLDDLDKIISLENTVSICRTKKNQIDMIILKETCWPIKKIICTISCIPTCRETYLTIALMQEN